MRFTVPRLTLALPFLFLAGTAQASEVQRSIEVAAPSELVWEEVGGFCSIADWHPDVASCTLEEDDVTTYRTVEMTDGKTFRDQLLGGDGDSETYTYSTAESPWPVTGLIGEFEVAPGPDGTSFIVWQAEYSTLAVDEDAATDELGRLYENGLEGIAELFDEVEG